ncbi:intracellular protein transport protein USO1 [Teleopsis dalmanni]|uniref:intracellular protein transport protein USO1 n=1 Tax=Teleopsis dalmanni TaxID=139649 RepID=UPI0018CE8D2B|nr:intracellular protein transport protein USO1 [Teleopsis dalmanni]
MSFSKAKLKRFNDVDIVCGSPAAAKLVQSSTADLMNAVGTPTPTINSTSSTSSAHPERKEQIEKFFKDAVRFASSSKESKEFAVPKDGAVKEDKKSKGLRLFRTPSLPHRLRFRHNSDATAASNNNNNNGSGSGSIASASSSTHLHSATTTPIKELSKSASRLKGKEALQHEIRKKNEIIESYMSQIDVLKRHVEQLKETELKLREENSNAKLKTEQLVLALTAENSEHKELNDKLSAENAEAYTQCSKLEVELKQLNERHAAEIEALNAVSAKLKDENNRLEQDARQRSAENATKMEKIEELNKEIKSAHEKIASDIEKSKQNFELIQNLKNTNDALIKDVTELKSRIEQDALAYAQETRAVQNQMDCLKNERNTLKNDLASKCEFIRSLQDELLDKNCEIDAHCDTIRQLCRENAKYVEKERFMETAEEKVRLAEVQAEQKVQKLESDLENAIETEKAYWRSELQKRQKLAENEIIRIELEKQDVIMLLETTNDMLRERDEKIQKYEEQLRNGIDYYIQLNETLQKQIADLKQDIAKTLTEKYNYQLTLSNTRSTVNILMERLKKSDSDVEQFKAELESVQLAKGALEQSYLSLQTELESMRHKFSKSEEALEGLRDSSQTLQKEERIDADAANYLDLYNELKNKDEMREIYMQDMKKALDEFATVLQFAKLELDSKEKILIKVRDECEKLKLENISLKSKIDDTANKKENITDLEKIEDLLIDSELRAECEKITSWLLNTSEKCVRHESSTEISELLKPTTPNNKTRNCTTPVRSSAGKVNNTTPRTPKTPHTPRTTPKKTVLFAGKENVPSPQKQVLKARNM